MNPAGKKFISLFLVFSLMMLSVNLYAKERRGAKLVITKKDGTQFQGELIAVKQNSLLILVPSGKDVSVGVVDIREIKIVKKSTAGKGALIGVLIGSGGGALLGFLQGTDTIIPGYLSVTAVAKALFWGLSFGTLGALLGAIIGAVSKKNKTIQIERMPDAEIQETLNKLRKKARVREYK